MSAAAISYVDVPYQIDCNAGVFPKSIVNDGTLRTQAEYANWIQQNIAEIGSTLRQSGAILFLGFPIDSAQTFDEFPHAFDLCRQDGDVALVDNYMTMHRRRAYSGECKREVLVVLSID